MTSQAQPLITFSIVSHGHSVLLAKLLKSLMLWERTKDFELILTDNLGDELPEFDPAPWANLKVLRNSCPQGFAKNQNQAFRYAKGEYFCILNPDVVLREPVCNTLINHLITKKIDIISPLVIDTNGNVQDSFRSLPTLWSLVLRQISERNPEAIQTSVDGFICPDWIAGIFLLMPKKIFEGLEGFDERYTLYFEDVEFCIRAGLEGLKLAVDPGISIFHDAQRSSHSKLEYLLRHLRSAIVFFASETYRAAKKSR